MDTLDHVTVEALQKYRQSLQWLRKNCHRDAVQHQEYANSHAEKAREQLIYLIEADDKLAACDRLLAAYGAEVPA